MPKKLKRNPNPPPPGPTGSESHRAELMILEYELGALMMNLAQTCGYLDNVQKRLAQVSKAMLPNEKGQR